MLQLIQAAPYLFSDRHMGHDRLWYLSRGPFFKNILRMFHLTNETGILRTRETCFHNNQPLGRKE
jgi:hypothetical protein